MNANHYDPQLLAEARKKRITQKQLAEKLGVTEMTIYRAEKGKTASYDLLAGMCREIGIDITKILTSSPAKNFCSST